MKTYKQVIDLLELQVRNFDAFPDESTKLQEQINAVYRYSVALAKSMPFSKLVLSNSENLATEGLYTDSDLVEASLPDDINNTREDLGVHLLNFAGVNKSVTVFESSPIETVKMCARNLFHKGTFVFTFDAGAKKIYTLATHTPVTVEYAPKIPEATIETYEDTNVPLDNNTIEVLVEALAAQFTSVNARDLSASQIHSTLSQILSE